MPKRADIKSVLVIGAGPIVIGQACEFDYSGTQALKAIKDEGCRVILINSNPATIMTDPELADATYIEPITPEFVSAIIEKERPDVILPTMGGQTALNTTLSLKKSGVLDKYNVEMIGASAEAIDMAEDRELFREAMREIGLETPKSILAHSLSQGLDAIDKLGLPVIIRPSFTMGGTGGGIAYTREEFIKIVENGIDASPTSEVLIEESVLGWKEYEMEVVRDKNDNCIIICSIENIDAMGIHTGDSITVAPALTLTDKEYQIMRNASIAILRKIGVETGGSNVQFAVNPSNGQIVVIEMNPRVSRSSALASKATGFPIAKVAAKLALGYSLDELKNDITGGQTPASFEPTIDYIVTKIPRFAFEKFPGAQPSLTTSMKSVGEAMAFGRTFAESLQKALRSLETGLTGLDPIEFSDIGKDADKNIVRAELGEPTPDRILKVAQALRLGISHDQIYQSCKMDPWFIDRIQEIIDMELKISKLGLPIDKENMLLIKSFGFSDARLANLIGKDEAYVRNKRLELDIHPVFKRIDTCSAEFHTLTAYMYSTYSYLGIEDTDCEANPSNTKKVIIIGGGPNRIGQGIEFDYCCCHACFALKEMGIETIMINCNPETVSTDYDTSDRLYFEPLTTEDIFEIIQVEKQNGNLLGVIVQFGGQTPLKLSDSLSNMGINILGTTPDTIDLAEDRDRFQKLIQDLNLKQPKNRIAYSINESRKTILDIGLPIILRPSYVLGGRAMVILRDDNDFDEYIENTLPALVPEDIKSKFPQQKEKQINTLLSTNPLLLDSYLSDAIEIDVDAISDGLNVHICGIMQHIEEAGVHSGDSACSIPPYSLDKEIIKELEEQTIAISLSLNIIGCLNIQFAVKDRLIYIIEVNPRASRTIPFVAKVTGQPISKIATKIILGEELPKLIQKKQIDHIAVKEAVFPFLKFEGVDVLLGPEMKSTGEVMGIGDDFEIAFAKSQLGTNIPLPKEGNVFVSVKDKDKKEILSSIEILQKIGFNIQATGGTQRYLMSKGIYTERVNKVLEGRPHIVDSINNNKIDLVINTTEGTKALSDSKSLRQAALRNKIPYYTTLSGAKAAIVAIEKYKKGLGNIKSLQEYFK
ncbi:MAG: carbamoyl phosphate synthase large subunit [Rhodobiaceae bacterium]|nr:carbamoyl phosphate synthase large subunit [Rhodobiaceae bacterium]|tara:strand:- start:47979 stop:51284 length:3306 start_codon:yes stop_codon:yes gene_type:complete